MKLTVVKELAKGWAYTPVGNLLLDTTTTVTQSDTEYCVCAQDRRVGGVQSLERSDGGAAWVGS